MNNTNQELELAKQKLAEIDLRLKQPDISDTTYRELLKSKNELLADVQALELNVPISSGKSFNRLLNESKEL